MKVMCINDADWGDAHTEEEGIGPVYGEVCHVIEDKPDFYKLAEYPLGWYWKEEFIPISDSDEEEQARLVEWQSKKEKQVVQL